MSDYNGCDLCGEEVVYEDSLGRRLCAVCAKEAEEEICSEEADYADDAVLDVFDESFDPDGYTEEDYRALMDRI